MQELWGNPMNPRHREKIQTPAEWYRPVLQQDDRGKFPRLRECTLTQIQEAK